MPSTALGKNRQDAGNRLEFLQTGRPLPPTGLTLDHGDEPQGVAIRHALDRMRNMAAEADAMYRRWHEAVEEMTGLRQQLTTVADQLAASDRREAARFSNRARALLRRLKQALHGSLGRHPTGPTDAAAPSIAEEKAAATAVASPTAEQPAESTRSSLTYAPLRWNLGESASAGDNFINLIILSANHRAGSTLLQRICNARKGTLVWGEHGGLLNHYAAIYMDAAYFSTAGSEEHERYFGGGEDPNLWIANMCPAVEYAQQAVVESARAFLRTFYGQYREHHDILGFKEVAYARPELELLRRCYPKAQILFLVRNPMNTWRSTPRSWYPSLDDWMTKWNASTRCFRDFAQEDANSHLIRYEDIVRKEPATLAVLAESAKVFDEHLSLVLGHKLGSHNAGISDAERERIADRCRESMELFGYSA
ncbi:MAG: sulfotransferase [Thermoguttaceae bacterium]